MGKFLDAANTVMLDEKAKRSSTEYDINDLYDKSLSMRVAEGSLPSANYDKSPPAIPATRQNQVASNSRCDKSDISDKSLMTGLPGAFLQPVNCDKRVSDLIHWRGLSPEQLQNVWVRVKQGAPVRIYSGTLSECVWWARDEAQADELKSQGINEAIYTAAELRALAGKPPEFLKDVHQFKRSFGATLVSASAQPEPADATPGSDTANPSAGQVACGDCQHFTPDTLGDGTGIGRCEAGCVARPGVDMPHYPRALQRCNSFSSKEVIPC